MCVFVSYFAKREGAFFVSITSKLSSLVPAALAEYNIYHRPEQCFCRQLFWLFVPFERHELS